MGKKYSYSEIEKKYQKKWEEEQTYSYRSSSQKETFVIDTPPPTVSGSLHIGHIFSYTQTDILARFHRMLGKNVFYPMGWDDNGLPTEKRVQNLYAVRCDPTLPYDPSFKAEKKSGKSKVYQSISRRNFLEICNSQVLEDEVKYKNLWNHIALSVDWQQTYRTIDTYAQTLAQISFLDLYAKQLVENRFSPVLWDTQFQTAVAQADIEDREQKGFFHDIAFSTEDSAEFIISTTRPELLPACVAITAHPEDERYKRFFGKKAISPLFYRQIPILPSPHADPEKGTGILMVCTFGDMEDVVFCKKQDLPVLQIIDDEGVFMDICFDKEPFKSARAKEANSNYSYLKGLRVKQARRKIVEILKEKSYLRAEPKECLQNVKFYEKGDFPLEILPKRQWYIKILDHKEELLHQGRKISWHPPSMRKRYEQWVEGLNQDWCISRQRQYGVPFPVWYKVDKKGQIDYKQIIVPKKDVFYNKPLTVDPHNLEIPYFTNLVSFSKESFPVDPLKEVPKGFKEEQREQADGFSADTNVMDTWATSSLSPYINSAWVLDLEKHKRLFPADLRPQGHEIIRTWAFYTIAKAYFHEKSIPWKNIAVSGWVVSPERMKISKSKGKSFEPEGLINSYSADAVRYWAAKARLGQDTAYNEDLFKTGHRLAVKIFNASKFVQMQVEDIPFSTLENSLKEISAPIDQAWVKNLLNAKAKAIKLLQNYDYAGALENIEKTFWSFCDNYIELVKARVYQLKGQVEGISGKRTLDYSLYTFLKLFAPYLPYVTEKLWGERYSKESSSIHSSLWLTESSLKKLEKKLSRFAKDTFSKESILENAFFILEQIRSKKSNFNKSLASPLERLEIRANRDQLEEFEFYKQDIARAAHVNLQNIFTVEQSDLEKSVVKIKFED